MKNEVNALCAHLALGMFNGMYQGLLVTALVAGLLRWVVRTNAATRHAVWLGTLVLLVLMIPLHCWLDSFVPSQAAPEGERLLAQPPTPAPYLPAPGSPAAASETVLAEQDFSIPGLENAMEEPASPGPLSRDSAAPMVGTSVGQPPMDSFSHANEISIPGLNGPQQNASVTRMNVGPAAAVLKLLRPGLRDLRSTPPVSYVLALLGVWIGGASLQLGLLAQRMRTLRRLSLGSLNPAPALESLFADLLAAAGVTRKVELRVSQEQRCPIVLGFVRPVILLPAALAEPTEQARQVLAHELAHVRRYDDWINLGQHFVQALLFFHPAVWWIGKRLSLEREIACDDYVLLHGTARRNYALTLTSVAVHVRQQPPVLAPGVSNNRSQLQQRISMILNTRRNSSPCLAKGRLASIIGLAALLAGLALYAAPRLVFAGTPSPETAPTTAAASPSIAIATEPGPSAAIAGSGVVVAETASADGAPAGIEPGPKFKPGDTVAEPPVPPEPPATSEDLVSPARPHRVARAGKPGKTPRPPELSDSASGPDGSIEDRLNRLEKMVRSLMEQQGLRRPRGAFNFRDGSDLSPRDEQKLEKLNQFADMSGDELSQQKMKELIERQTARAAEQAERAAEQANRATRDIQARVNQDQQGRAGMREALQQQLEALQQARENLSQEMERLNRQIQKIEREKQRADKEKQRRSEATTEKFQAQNEPAPEQAP